MAGNRRVSGRRKNECAYMGKREKANTDRDRGRFPRRDTSRRDPEGASIRETSDSKESDSSRIGAAGKFSCVILTKEELRQVIEAFATCLEHSALFPQRFDIIERARDGIYALHIIAYLPRQKRSVSSSRLDRTGKENS
jgi:hypothetical protein